MTQVVNSGSSSVLGTIRTDHVSSPPSLGILIGMSSFLVVPVLRVSAEGGMYATGDAENACDVIDANGVDRPGPAFRASLGTSALVWRNYVWGCGGTCNVVSITD